MKKSVFLVFTLAIPVSIFLFLKFFGSNSFEVPIMFQDGIPNCQETNTPHRVHNVNCIDDEDMPSQISIEDKFLVFGVIKDERSESDRKKLIELVRIQDAFYEIGAPLFVIFYEGSVDQRTDLEKYFIELGMQEENFQIIRPDPASYMGFLRCGIALIDNEDNSFDNLVLVDTERNIRGVYKSLELEQTDLLILELKILKETM